MRWSLDSPLASHMTRTPHIALLGCALLLSTAGCDTPSGKDTSQVDATAKDTSWNQLEDSVTGVDYHAPVVHLGDSALSDSILILPDWNADFEDLQPRFGSATENEFLAAQGNVTPLDISGSLLTETDSTFSFLIGGVMKEFRKPVFDTFGIPKHAYAEHRGYIPSLHLHVIEEVSVGEFILGSLLLMDAQRHITYHMDSWSDATMSVPVLSPSGKHLLMHVNGITDPNRSMLVILEAYPEEEGHAYRVVAQNHSEKWNIEGAAWMDASTFILKTDTRTYDQEKGKWVSRIEYKKARL